MAIQGVYTSSTGIQAASLYLDAVGNNLANSDTTGFKTVQVSFQDLLYVGPAGGLANPTGTRVGGGGRLSATTGLFTQGGLTPTQNQYDLAIDGPGFFAVRLPDGTVGFTRAGNLNPDSAGRLVTADGLPLLDNVVIPADARAVAIGRDGSVTATTPAGTVAVGTITLTRFTNPAGLTRVGESLFAFGPAAGAATTGTPGVGGIGTLAQGFLERSNVDVPNELINLVIAQRAFQLNSRAVQVESDVLSATTALIR